ncbi:MAG: protein tyrosine phosphatase [Pseudonocardiales bacterium]|nr:protein tyrosine phosphatase [Pseudonocardiales bacterium]
MPEPNRATNILVVCTGNLHRSPIIETVLRAELGSSSHYEVTSAGTVARWWHRWPSQTVAVLADAGYPVERSRARRLNASQVKRAALIITATRAHRANVMTLDPTAELRCFTLLEATRYLREPHYPSKHRAGVSGVLDDLQTALSHDRGDHNDDLIDPAGGTDADFDQCLRSVQICIGVIATRLDTL